MALSRQHMERAAARLDLYDARDNLRDPKMHFESSVTKVTHQDKFMHRRATLLL